MLQTDVHRRGREDIIDELMQSSPTGLSSTNTVNLEIGDICCSFRCHDDNVCNRLREMYGAFLTEQTPPDMTVELVATDRLNPKDLGKTLSRTKYVHDKKNRFRTSSKIMSGQYDLENRYIKIVGEKNLVNPDLENNHLNKLFAMAYYSACKVKYGEVPPAMLVHAAGILRQGRAWIFTGPSEAGKTTVATLCREQDGEVINDEILLVSQPGINGGNISVRSAPILGRFIPRRRISAPLGGIFMLKKGPRTLVSSINRTEACTRLMRQIITPAYIGQSSKRAVLSLIADFSSELSGAVPVYELEFTLDGESLWQVVDGVEGMTGIREPQ
jgi:hypothetical protein